LTPRLLLTAGPTREPLDPVRFLSNASTGAQGVALACEAVDRGWDVDFVHGPLELPLPAGVALHGVTTAREMLDACLRLHSAASVVIGAAAVCDYRPRCLLRGKHKRDERGWTIELEPTDDVLLALGERKGPRIHAGFALETEDLLANARRKLERKRLDFIVANPASAIGAVESAYLLLDDSGGVRDLGVLSKRALARVLLDAVDARLRDQDDYRNQNRNQSRNPEPL
jgi:phosphopantothenoylcysteine decarboxylase/phosphopantothenate--cysteine ligase